MRHTSDGKRGEKMSDLIKRSDAIKAIEDKVNGSENRLWLKEIVSEIPSADIPHSDDWERYSDKLWKIAYERGKADRPQGEWIDDGLDGIGVMGVEYRWHKCSQCGFRISKLPSAYYPNFCEACGAQMKGADDE